MVDTHLKNHIYHGLPEINIWGFWLKRFASKPDNLDVLKHDDIKAILAADSLWRHLSIRFSTATKYHDGKM